MVDRIRRDATPEQIEDFLKNLRPNIEKSIQESMRTRTEICPVHGLPSKIIKVEYSYSHAYGVFKCPKGDIFKMS